MREYVDHIFAGLIWTSMLACPATAAERNTSPPDFSGLWGRNSFELEQPPSGPGPLVNRMRRPNGTSNINMMVGDYTNPILKPDAAAQVKKLGEISLGGNTFADPVNQCWPYPPPYLSAYNWGMRLFQKPGEITIIQINDHQVRHVRMNQSHPQRITPTWHGDTIGHYEGDILVLDTVGIKTAPLSMLDTYGTPHSEKLHVVERYRLIDGDAANKAVERHEKEQSRIGPNTGAPDIAPDYKGPGLQVQIMVEDEGVFTIPWNATVTYRQTRSEWFEDVCADTMRDYSGRDIQVPRADTPDF